MVLPVASGAADTAVANLARFGWLKLDDDPAHGLGETDVAARRAEHLLPFEAVYTDGGEYSERHAFRHLCVDDQSCYSSQLGRNKAVNVVAKFNDSGRCTVDAVTVRTPIEGYNSPVAQVIVFASLGPPRLDSVSNFDGVCSEAKYSVELDCWTQQAHSHPTIPKPVAFVSMRGKCLATVPAAISRSSRYLVIKLLRAQGDFDNIDVEYVGAHGWPGRCLCPCRTTVLN